MELLIGLVLIGAGLWIRAAAGKPRARNLPSTSSDLHGMDFMYNPYLMREFLDAKLGRVRELDDDILADTVKAEHQMIRDGETLTFIAPDQRRYRVYDVMRVGDRGKRVPLGDPRATHRIFKPVSCAKLAAILREHDVTEAALTEQLARAGYIGKHIYRGPGAGDGR